MMTEQSQRPTAAPTGRGLSRRTFLQGVGAVLAAGAATRWLDPLAPGAAAQEAFGATLPLGTPILVLVELPGGNDILNTIVPMAVPGSTGHYRDARPTIAITRVTTSRPYASPTLGDLLPPALDLDGQWALHGALPWLANRWHNRGDVAIVQGTGENVMREQSHFVSSAYRWAGAFTGELMETGWLGRYNDLANPGQSLGAVSTFGAHQALVSRSSPAVAIDNLATFDFSAANVPDPADVITGIGRLGKPASTAPGKVATAAAALVVARKAIVAAHDIPPPPADPLAGTLARQLDIVAALIQAGVPCQTYLALDPGFDTHGGQPGQHLQKLDLLNEGLRRFFLNIDASPRAADVFVVIQSEFGRQVGEAAGQGTDHGLGSDSIMIGGGVQGGWYGEPADLAPAARYADSLVPTVDFRSVYATILNRLGGDPNLTEEALGRNEGGVPFADLGVFAGAGAVPSPGAQALGPDGRTVPAPEPEVRPELAYRLGVQV